VLTATGYGIDQPPEEGPDASVINLRRVELLRSVMDDHGDSDKAIWLTEYGWNASPDTIPDQLREWGSVTDQQQAEWTANGIRWMSENWEWFGVSSIWYFRQVGHIPADSPEYYFAMVDPEFTPREVYLGVKRDANEHRIALPGVYGPMEAPLQQTGQWRRFDNSGAPYGESIASSTWGSEVRVEFSGTDLRIETAGPETLSGWMYVTLNGEPAQSHLFSVDDLGRTYLDLDQLEDHQQTITVVDEYGASRPQETNIFVLHIHENASFSINAIHVDYQRSYRQFALISLLAFAGIAGSGIIIGRRFTV
jgi:polysaccharide biosynthesis protein PslG